MRSSIKLGPVTVTVKAEGKEATLSSDGFEYSSEFNTAEEFAAYMSAIVKTVDMYASQLAMMASKSQRKG